VGNFRIRISNLSFRISSRQEAALWSFGVGVATLALMLATEPQMAIGWDEGYTLGREARLRDWFWLLRNPGIFGRNWRPPALELVQRDGTTTPRPDELDTRRKLLFGREALEWFWPFAREEPNGHPPFYAILGLAGDLVVPSWRALPRARLGPIVLFSVTGGVIFGFFFGRSGISAAALAAGSWALHPNLFGHGHYAAYDAVLTSLWVLAVIVFAHAVIPKAGPAPAGIRWGCSALLGLIIGCAAATKLTGWFVPLPFLGWALLYRNANGVKMLAIAVLIGLIVLLALMPPWWQAPMTGIARFLDSNLNRAKTIPIVVQFLGSTYKTPQQSLPWYNTLLWTVLVTPIGFLVFGGLGFWTAVRYCRTEPLGLLLAGHWAFLMILRALPGAPGHDGVRLFLPAFGLLALLGGYGAELLFSRGWRWIKPAVALALAEGAISVAVMMPVPLAYFSPVVGGLPGAAALGMEPTYYWDALDSGARQFLAEHTPAERTIVFRTFPTSWLYLRQTGELPNCVAGIDPGLPLWVVLQNRPGAFSRDDRILAEQGVPAFTVTKLGVPLVWIFPYSEIERLGIGRSPKKVQSAGVPARRNRMAFCRPTCQAGSIWPRLQRARLNGLPPLRQFRGRVEPAPSRPGFRHVGVIASWQSGPIDT
jgi:4-amino-4-deoxy-L-arabinose transferase-like glycosyltransferase